LIGSDKVEGTAVYGADTNKIGAIERVMIDKLSGKTSYAVLSFGGFLGIGDDYYPLPWQSLKYDTRLGGYVGITEDKLKGGPKYVSENSWNWSEPVRARAIDDYYGGAVAQDAKSPPPRAGVPPANAWSAGLVCRSCRERGLACFLSTLSGVLSTN